MQGRWKSLAGTALAFLLITAIETQASEMLPRYTITDLGPYQDSIGGSPRFDAAGNLSYRYGNPSEGTYSIGLIHDPDRSSFQIGTYLRKNGSDENLLSADLSKVISAFYDVSANGEVIGIRPSGASGSSYEPFYFNSQTGEQLVMKSMAGSLVGRSSVPIGMNDLHQIVGRDGVGNAAGEGAILYTNPNADPILLSTLVENLGDWQLSSATDIDNQGRIIGFGIRNDLENDRGHYFRLDPIPTPVPEPTSLCAFTAVAGVILAARRRRRSLRLAA